MVLNESNDGQTNQNSYVDQQSAVLIKGSQGMVDNTLGTSKCGNQAVATNAVINSSLKPKNSILNRKVFLDMWEIRLNEKHPALSCKFPTQ